MALGKSILKSTRKAPPRRSQEERTAAARQRILAAARHCFERYGYRQTSMNRIAKVAGVSRGLLHYHFETKEKLTLTVWDHEFAAIFERMADMLPTAQPTPAWTSQLIDRLWQEVSMNGTLVPMVADLVVRATSSPRFRRQFRERLHHYAEMVARGAELLLLPTFGRMPLPAPVIADMFLIVCGGFAMYASAFDDDGSGDRLRGAIEGLKTIFIQTLFPNQARSAAA